MREFITGCVQTAQAIIKKRLFIAFHASTQWYPRLLPRTELEFERLQQVLVQCYGLDDHPDTWQMVAGQITSTPASSVRKSYRVMANAAKRLKINLIAHNQKIFANDQRMTMLKEKTLKVADEFKKEEDFLEAKREHTDPEPDSQSATGVKDPNDEPRDGWTAVQGRTQNF